MSEPGSADDTSTGGLTPGAEGARRTHGPREGDRIGAYVLRRKLGEGGMGIVFEAEQQTPIQRTVALKLMKPGMDSTRVLARFEAERQTLARMSHPNIARVYDAGMTEAGHPFFVMEYVPGLSLVGFCTEKELDLRRKLELFIDVCRGVQHAHQKGIVHRDLKPTNILVQERDGEHEVKIIDFGIARAVDPTGDPEATMTVDDQLVGTPAYMSPEQATLGNPDIDTRTDIYSLGVVLYELIAGSRPFEFADARKMGLEEMLRRVREETPPQPSRRVESGNLARELDWITMRAIEKDRERRYDSAADLARDVSSYLNHEPVAAGPPSLSYRARKFVRRHRAAVVFSTLLAFSLVLGATLSTVGFVRARRAEAQARYEADTSSEVIDFLVELFQISDPGEARGNAVTAREILDRGVESIRLEWTERPDVRGRLLETMGLVYRSLGLYGVAQPLLGSAVGDYREAYGGRSAEVADALNSLAGLLLIQRRADEAKPLLEEAGAIQDEVLSPDDERRARTLNNLGLVARLEDRMEDALAYYRASLDLRRAELGHDHVELIKPLANLASLYRALRNDEESLAHYRRALEIADARLPEDHPDVARLLNNLATLHRTFGRQAEALRALERVLAIRERVLGPEHPDLVPPLVSLGEACLELADAERARRSFERALALGEAKLPEGHPLVRQARAGLEKLDGSSAP